LPAQSALEVEPVMAAFVHRFTQFVDWPEPVLAGGQMDICVAGSESLVQTLQQLIAEADAGSRPLAARLVSDPASVTACHVLFISSVVGRTPLFVNAAMGPILTVSDAPAFLDEGGMIELRIIDRRIRFAINAQAANSAGLRLSSQLLDLAIEVRGDFE
jgi:hypothetical protein